MQKGRETTKLIQNGGKNRRVLIKGFYRKETRQKKRRVFFRRALAFVAVALIAFGLGGYLAFRYFYNHYEAIVRNRIESGFWQSRAGIYSAPRNIRVGQQMTRKELIELLRRSGYVEGKTADTFWNGTYTIADKYIEIQKNRLFESRSDIARIAIKNGIVTRIFNDQGTLSAYRIRPEMLTGRSAAKRTGFQTLKYSDIPENLKKAIIVTEDRRFFEHNGLDPRGIIRAFWANISERRITQGGSTITQQLVKNTFLTNERTFSRKFAEAFLSLALENLMTKEEIFTLYCNEIYLGQYGVTGVHGFGMASRAYFDKDIADLTLAEAVTLASMIRRPNHFAFGKNEEELAVRRRLILDIMNDQGMISFAEADPAKKEEIAFSKPKAESDAIAPYFVDSVIRDLPNRVGNGTASDADDNLRIYTTIDTQLQKLAEQAVERHLRRAEKKLASRGLQPQATLIALDPHTGAVLAMVGGSDYAETQYNRATQARRQPGSVFKPFVYAAALERGHLPSSIFSDEKMEFEYDLGKTYRPANYGDRYTNEEITLKTALARSSNVVAVQAALRTGLKGVAAQAVEFGFENISPYPSIALGTIEVTPIRLAAAYASFANRGVRVEPTFINRIVSGEGSTIYAAEPPQERIISEQTAYMITDMLRAVVDRGTARKAKASLGENVAFVGKTGSSKDSWFVGYTPNLVTVAWVGIDENEDIGLTGSEAALPLWTDFMKQALGKRPEFGGRSFVRPPGLLEVRIDPETGMRAGANCPVSEKMVLPASTAPNFECFRHKDYPDYHIASVTADTPQISEPIPIEDIRIEINSGIDQARRETEELRDIGKTIRRLENFPELQKANLPEPSKPEKTAPVQENKSGRQKGKQSSSRAVPDADPENVAGTLTSDRRKKKTTPSLQNEAELIYREIGSGRQ